MNRNAIAAVASVLVAGVLIGGGLRWLNRGHQSQQPTGDPMLSVAEDVKWKPYWDVPAFSYTDQEGRAVTERDLRGRIWIANFIFTQCSNACPLMTAKMVLLQRQIADPEVRFVSFSVDPEHDTQAVLNDYAKEWNHDPRWLLLQTDAAGIQQTAAGMKVSVQKSVEKDNPIIHSNLFFLVDEKGQVRGLYNSDDDDAMASLVRALKKLPGTTQPATQMALVGPEMKALDGHELFAQLGCGACHTQARIAPSLAGIFGTKVKLNDQRVVEADEAYLRESILEPGEKLVAGYQNLMPSYRGFLSDGQVEQLVKYIKSGAGGLGKANKPSTRELLVDIVCGMKVSASEDSPQAAHLGKTYYFCSPACREKFIKDAAKYLKNPGRSMSGGGKS